jgi:hypothetical protein
VGAGSLCLNVGHLCAVGFGFQVMPSPFSALDRQARPHKGEESQRLQEEQRMLGKSELAWEHLIKVSAMAGMACEHRGARAEGAGTVTYNAATRITTHSTRRKAYM